MTTVDTFYSELEQQLVGGVPPWSSEESYLDQSAAEEPDTLLQIRWVKDALANPPAEPPVLIEGMLRAGELCTIGAPRGIGKSWLVDNMAILLARGEGCLFGQLRIVKPCKVLIVQGENDEWESYRRWRILMGSDGAPDGIAETFDRVRVHTIKRRSTSVSSFDGSHSSDEWIDARMDSSLEATIATYGFDVLIIDPWAVFYTGAENSNDEVEAALDKLRYLAMRHRVAIVIMHHFGKSTEAREPEDLWRGASRLADWASTRITLKSHYTTKQAKDQGMTREQARRYVDVLFLRRSTSTPDFSMVLDPETCWWSRWVSSPEENSQKIKLSVEDIVDACRRDGGAWPSLSHAAHDLGVSRATARKPLDDAVRSGDLDTGKGARGAIVYRLPGGHLGDENEVER